MVMTDANFDFSRLSVRERIQLAEDLWDSVAAETPSMPLTKAEIEELERRLDELERNPDACIPWEEVRARLEELLDSRH